MWGLVIFAGMTLIAGVVSKGDEALFGFIFFLLIIIVGLLESVLDET